MTGPANIASKVIDSEVAPGLRLVTLPMGVEDVVTIAGSMYGGDIFSPDPIRATADITAAMLDKGTSQRDKFEMGALLENVGASIGFSSDDFRLNFSARCLKSDLALTIELLAEQLREPAFDDADLASLQKRIEGSLKRQLESTEEQARIAFRQALYQPEHPNYSPSIEAQIEAIKALTTVELKDFHRQHYGRGSMVIVATGDFDRKLLERQLAERFGDWATVDVVPPALDNLRADLQATGTEKFLPMPEKTSVDLFMGMPIGIDREHPDYMPLVMATFILGGNFSARLMAKVRDEAGLTYGIGSSVGGATDGKDGFWAIRGTFAPELLGEGRSLTMGQFEKWLGAGALEEELAAKKTTITGSYQVGLASTRGMAGALLDILERGKELSYIDTYPDEISALKLDEVNAAIGNYLSKDRLVVVAAGSIDEQGHPVMAKAES